jgi:hypothetical protein
MKTIRPKKVDMNRFPFRGIYTELAEEEGVSRQAIQQAAAKGNPKILSRVAEKVKERQSMVQEFNNVTTGGRARKPKPERQKTSTKKNDSN